MPQREWLPHLVDSVPNSVSGDRLSIYSIALEGWRRGLDVKFYNVKYRNKVIIRYSLFNGSKEIKFSYSTGPDVTRKAREICASKILTKRYLSEAKIPVPKGEKFDGSVNDEEIVEYADSIGYPVVLKPSGGKMGRGVIPNIKSESELKKSLTRVRGELGYKSVIVEEFVTGEEYRIYVIDGKVIGAMNRIPPNIIGDGTSTIRQLIKEKNKRRDNIPSVRGRPIKIDKETRKNIKQAGFTLDSVLPKDQRLFVKKTSNISAGGDPVDATDELPDHIKQVAVDAVKAIPGLVECGVDLIFDKNRNTGKIIELNTSVGLGGHLFPLEGKARDIPKALIDYYFPETVSQRNELLNKLYFDFTKVTSLLKDSTLTEVTLPKAPIQNFNIKGFRVYGHIKGVGYMTWVKKNARYLDLSGFVKGKSDGSVFIVVAGDGNNISKFKNLLLKDRPRRAKVREVKETEWNKPVEIGFEIIKENQKQANKLNVEQKLEKKLKNVEEKNKILEEKLREMTRQKDRYRKEYQKVLSSNSWKWTKPMRKLGSLIKGDK